MFGFGKKKIPTGAREKIEMAKQMRAAGRYNVNTPGKAGGGNVTYPSQVIPVTLFYAVAIILSMILMNNSTNPLSGLTLTGIPSIDDFVTGTGIATFTSDPDQNQIFTIFGRGTAFFIMAGFVPGVSFVLERLLLRDRVTPFVICWGVITIMMLVYLCWSSLVSFAKIF